MTWVTALSMLVFVGVCSAVGIRLLVLWRRTRGKPELYCGLSFVLLCLVGQPLAFAAGTGRVSVGEVDLVLWCTGTAAVYSGIGFVYAFTAVAFRAEDRRSLLFTRAGACLSGLGYFGALRTLLTAPPEASSFDELFVWNALLQTISCVGFGWTGIEGVLQWRKCRLRARVGLADPLVANRFLLWGIYGGISTTLTLIFLAGQLVGIHTMGSRAVHLATALLGGSAGLTLYVAFFPPPGYARWLRAEQAEGGSRITET